MGLFEDRRGAVRRLLAAGDVGNENWLLRLPDRRLAIVFRDWNGSSAGQLAIAVSTTE